MYYFVFFAGSDREIIKAVKATSRTPIKTAVECSAILTADQIEKHILKKRLTLEKK